MEEKAKKLCGFIFLALVAVGLVLAIVGMCTGIVTASVPGESESIGLFHEQWATLSKLADEAAAMKLDVTIPSRTFALIAFIVMLIGVVLLVVDAILRVFVGKDLKIVRIIGVALAFVGAILVLVAGILMAGDFKEFTKLDIY
ncbi:MAG: hypothetical protein K2L54_05360, partial [Clostridiales bacterium]|nr:hypothetical protein [Clostridiales bacterium]